MTNKGKSVVFLPISAAIPLLLAPDKLCSSYHYLASALACLRVCTGPSGRERERGRRYFLTCPDTAEERKSCLVFAGVMADHFEEENYRLTLICHFAPHIPEKNYGIAPSLGTAPPFGSGEKCSG